MTKKFSPLFQISFFYTDPRLKVLSEPARGFYMLLCAYANDRGGKLTVNDRALTLPEAAKIFSFMPDNLHAVIDELCACPDLLKQNEDGDGIWVIPDMVKAQNLREKRVHAGKRGGEKTTARREDICLSKKDTNLVLVEKSDPCERQEDAETKKEKRTKKEKNKNNNYIYILGKKVFTGDRGSPENPKFFTADYFTIWKREYRVLEELFPLFSDDRLDKLILQHDVWLKEQGQGAQEAWFACLLGFLKKVHAAEERASKYS